MNTKHIIGVVVLGAILVAAFVVLLPGVFSDSGSDANIADAQTCRDKQRYESCLKSGAKKLDCRNLYCARRDCAWYDFLCKWFGL